MSPLVWLLSFSSFDRNATFALIGVYLIVFAISVKAIRRGRNLTTVGLAGVSLDIIMLGALPIIWYTSLGGVELPAGITLKTSVTLFAILFISLNTLAIRPLYPLLVSVGSLLVHGALLIAALGDQQTSFTSNYLQAYTTAEVASGAVATRFAILILVGALLTWLTVRARKMILEAVHVIFGAPVTQPDHAQRAVNCALEMDEVAQS